MQNSTETPSTGSSGSTPFGQDAVKATTTVMQDIMELIDKGTKLQKEIEAYYHTEEKQIRSRVMCLDELETVIADERKCLEVQHEECRNQISRARRAQLMLRNEKEKMNQIFSRPHASLEKDEAEVDRKMADVTRLIEEEDKKLSELLDTKAELEKEEQELEAKEKQQYDRDVEFNKALNEIRKLGTEIEQRKVSLEQKNETVETWNNTLEAREQDIMQRQAALRDALLQLERQEPEFGVATSSFTAPSISQRQLMDDNDMSIDMEEEQEEINLDDN